MMTALADGSSRPAAPRSGARKRVVHRKRAGRPASPAKPGAGAIDPAAHAVAADVMKVLAAFGLED